MPLGKTNLNIQFENKIYGSMMLLLDHVLLKSNGYSAKTDIRFYEDVENEWNGTYTYTCPYKQFAYDKVILEKENKENIIKISSLSS